MGGAGKDTVAAVLKACQLLERFDVDRPVWTLADLTTASGMNKTTVFRLMGTLQHAGWVVRDPGGAYRLALRVFAVGSAAVVGYDFRTAAHPVLAALAAEHGDTAFLMVPAAEGAVCIDRVEGGSPLAVTGIGIGTVLPFHAAAGPMMMLALSPELRRRWITPELPRFTVLTLADATTLKERLDAVAAAGYVHSDGDYLDGVSAVAAPITGRSGDLVATISLGGSTDRFRDGLLADRVAAVRSAAAQLSRFTAAAEPGLLTPPVWG